VNWIHPAQERGQWQILAKTVMKVRFEVLAAVNMKIIVFWDVVPCSLVITFHKIEILMAMNLRVP
jgi:hypothetical protein